MAVGREHRRVVALVLGQGGEVARKVVARSGGGIGGALLKHLQDITDTTMLIGTWAAAEWAIRFYEAHGSLRFSYEEKERFFSLISNFGPLEVGGAA